MPILPYRGIQPRIAADAFIAEGVTLIGAVEIGPQSSVWFGSVLRGDLEPIRIGARSNLKDLCICHVTHGGFDVVVGDEVTVGHGAILHGCHIGDRVLVGMQSCVLDGARVGSEVVVAAGSLVPPGMEIPSGSLVMGRPARVVRKLTPADRGLIEEGWRSYLSTRLQYEQIPGARQ
jgi:carbonic anhydrase/acetyltransferase-like protein (isoleucine patch superfamily)